MSGRLNGRLERLERLERLVCGQPDATSIMTNGRFWDLICGAVPPESMSLDEVAELSAILEKVNAELAYDVIEHAINAPLANAPKLTQTLSEPQVSEASAIQVEGNGQAAAQVEEIVASKGTPIPTRPRMAANAEFS